jgi:hypothetical protein
VYFLLFFLVMTPFLLMILAHNKDAFANSLPQPGWPYFRRVKDFDDKAFFRHVNKPLLVLLVLVSLYAAVTVLVSPALAPPGEPVEKAGSYYVAHQGHIVRAIDAATYRAMKLRDDREFTAPLLVFALGPTVYFSYRADKAKAWNAFLISHSL